MGKYDLRYDTVETGREITQLGAFLRANRGDYDQELHERWLDEVCIPGVEAGDRVAMAWYRHGDMIGDTVLKPAGPDTVEIKNFRVVGAALKGRGLAGFMMRQIAPEAQDLLVTRGLVSPDAETLTLQLDTPAGSGAEAFFRHHGFSEVGRTALYQPGKTDVLMQQAVPLH